VTVNQPDAEITRVTPATKQRDSNYTSRTLLQENNGNTVLMMLQYNESGSRNSGVMQRRSREPDFQCCRRQIHAGL